MLATASTSLEWSLLFNVLFGSIASRAFAEFYQSMTADWDHDLKLRQGDRAADGTAFGANQQPRHYVLRIFAFVSAFAFYIYDWIVVQVLIGRYPYTVTSLVSYLRFANDVVMVFCLFTIVSNATRPRVLDHPFRMIVFVSVWHLLAALWHVLADIEYKATVDFDLSLRWHLVYVQALYWSTWIIFRYGIYRLRANKLGEREAIRRINHWIIGCECSIIFVMSIVRTFVVLSSV